MSRRTIALIVLVVVSFGLGRALRLFPQHDNDLAQVVSVVDGDTIVIEGGEQVRYIGIDTPETVPGNTQCYGDEATVRNRELVGGKRVRLVPEQTDRDRYGRLLRYVYVGKLSVSLSLIESGHARALYIVPDVQFYPQFKAAEEEAKAAGRGLWGACR